MREATEKQGHLTPERAKHLDELAAVVPQEARRQPRTTRRPSGPSSPRPTPEAPASRRRKVGHARVPRPEPDARRRSTTPSRSNYFPYGLSGIMLGASLVFFAFIGFDSISTHSEEAIKPQRDVPIGILASLFVCTVLYIAVSAVITGMEPYPEIDADAAVASAFRQLAEAEGGNTLLQASAGLIAAGGLAGMTSVLLITFLSQARIFLAMARDRLLPPSVFGAVHPKFRTPHISTMLTGAVITVVAAFTPILRAGGDGQHRHAVGLRDRLRGGADCCASAGPTPNGRSAARPCSSSRPLGIVVNVIMMLFLPIETWLRLVVWLVIGLVIYFGYGYSPQHARQAAVARQERR